jgi:hypothetical protein
LEISEEDLAQPGFVDDFDVPVNFFKEAACLIGVEHVNGNASTHNLVEDRARGIRMAAQPMPPDLRG